MDISQAVVYDTESFPNLFTFHMELFNSPQKSVWEISEYRNDLPELRIFLNHLMNNSIPMIGFNNYGYDYVIIHSILKYSDITYQEIYEINDRMINSNDRFANTIWDKDHLIPQIDLFKIHHFDNKAKSTNLKALQINMRSENVVESTVPFGVPVTLNQVNQDVIPYGNHDVSETKRFAKISKSSIDFRVGLMPQFGYPVMNWNDTKIGEQMLIQRIGPEVCFTTKTETNKWGKQYERKVKRQTIRKEILLGDIVFPYIKFEHPEFNKVLREVNQKYLTRDDLNEEAGDKLVTKGVFKNLIANVGGVDFRYGTGGVHASVMRQKFRSEGEWIVRDIDVEGLYPNIAIVNGLAPEHLGQPFVRAYSTIPPERKEWQARKGKKCQEANTLKLAANGAYGKTNDEYSCLFDPKYTMTITINGQLLVSMLADKLVKIPTLKFIQVNTDGITYIIHKDYEPYAKNVCEEWQALTGLKLEDADYRRMFIRDVNSYIAEDYDGKLKLKGAYEYPDPLNYEESISSMQPPGWHKNWSNIISTRAAVMQLVHDVRAEDVIAAHGDKFDFMSRYKANKSDKLMLGDRQLQRNTRYYVSTEGQSLRKISPARGLVGAFKRAMGVSEAEYIRVMDANGWQWDETVCTKNKSRYDEIITNIEAGWKVKEVNDASTFRFADIDYKYYNEEARKLVF